MRAAFAITVVVVESTLGARAVHAQTLRGSGSSMDRQHAVAIARDYTFLEEASDVRRFVKLGILVPVRGGRSYDLAGVSFPYARPEVRTFVERLAGQYRSACGEPLVVTSLTRPAERQPRNASDQSVHPTGMAVDLRVSRTRKCRTWLERTLLSLEKARVLEATRERRPAHYHIAVFPKRYATYVARTDRMPALATVARVGGGYRVHRGDTLWSIARRHRVSVDKLKELNGLSSESIQAGQTLQLPQ